MKVNVLALKYLNVLALKWLITLNTFSHPLLHSTILKLFLIFFLSFSARIILPLPIGLSHWHPLTDAISIFILFYFMVIISLFCTTEILPLWQLFFPNYVTEAVENCSQVPTFRPWMTTLLVKISSQLLIIAVFI